jgi:hypothetical protein
MPDDHGSDNEHASPMTITRSHPPNLLALAILQAVRERQQGRKPSQSSRTQEYLLEARAGKMYGNGNDAGE